MSLRTPDTYCNPLPIPNGVSGRRNRWHGGSVRSLADPTVFRHKGKWYLYVTGSQAWVSRDLVQWNYHSVDLPVEAVGPSIAEVRGRFYLSGNGGIGMWRSEGPLGPWRKLGDITEGRKKVLWADLMFFVDVDGAFYCYHHSGSGIGTDGIFVSRLDPRTDYTTVLGKTRSCFRFDPKHVWERFGDRHEFPRLGWIESPWMTKHRGRYYLQYSGCGTEWKKYAVGVYESRHPMGPFTYHPGSPILTDQGGLLNGTGHHAMVAGPGGALWCFYHVLFRNTNKFERYLAMDPAGFDRKGHLFVAGPTDTPQMAPGYSRRRPEQDNATGWAPLTENKEVRASSSAFPRAVVFGREAMAHCPGPDRQ